MNNAEYDRLESITPCDDEELKHEVAPFNEYVRSNEQEQTAYKLISQDIPDYLS